MEYRRVRRIPQRRRRGGATPAAALAIIVFAAGVYLFGASKLGTWLARQVVAPVISAMLPAENTVTPALISIVSPTPEPESETVLELSGLDCYAIQIGVYSDSGNASAQAERLQEMGAAGYPVQEEARTHILAAGYPDEASMQQVREQLKKQGVEDRVFEIHTDGARLSISGTDMQIKTLCAVLSAAEALPGKIYAAAISFDEGGMQADAGAELLSPLIKEAENQLLSIAALKSAKLDLLCEPLDAYFSRMTDCAEANCAASASHAEFSSGLKYLYLSSVFAYGEMISALAGD